ncbi:capsular polysaccharide biosynthesis protein [Massilia niastensis]|uniref:capsular polysaccharide biosynthesis protein n=1 Tax=Massilia niastensis TaxID=544911 RepID=UPI001E41937E|nr:capsular polysaccharide biosynthesis protein [Massilia niastensis]
MRREHALSWRGIADLKAVAGWGRRSTAERARVFARRHGLPFLALEDGFLRSVGLGVAGAAPLSLVVDDLGIYYDATQPSRLEAMIASLAPDAGLQERARSALDLIRRHRLSKYNHAPEKRLPAMAAPHVARVLVIDQTMGDVSVRLGGADHASFAAMLDAALAENPQAEIWVKTHPDVLSGKKQGYLPAADLTRHPDLRLHLLADDVSPIGLLEQVDKVYVVTSQMGFEALMLHKPVVCFGQPWYAGWGLTDDRHAGMPQLRARRNVSRTLEQLFEAAYLHYARYVNPDTGAPGDIFDVIDWLARNKNANDLTRGTLYCVGMSMWKRAIVRPFLEGPSTRLRFIRSVDALERQTLVPDARIVMWGVQQEARLTALAAARQVPLWRMEDGFLRSVGLGSDLFRPVSLVLDTSGMYYDPASGSALERMLATQELDAGELARAARFRQAYVTMRMSKYNLTPTPLKIDARGRRVLLVPGQVEDDASIMRGSPAVRSNLELLRTVRAANPDACILYKAHPDVVAGNRRGAVPPDELARLADQCVNEANIIDCILAADEVHTMTSLSGFEALLHGRIVHCYGGPFYAGWGLTIDHFALPQRQRKVSLDALVHAVMLAYPRYVLPGVPGFTSAEQVMHRLAEQSARAGAGLETGWLSRKARKGRALVELLRSEWLAHNK